MRVSFLISDLFHMGAQYATALMVRGFIAKGYEVDLLLSQYHVDMLNAGEVPFEIPAATNVIYMRHHRARHNIGELRRYIMGTDAKCVICMCPLNAKALRIAAVGLCKIPKLYFVEHGIAGIRDCVRISSPHMFTARWFYNKWYYSKFAGCLAVCKACVDDCWRIYNWKPDKVHLVYNPVIDAVFFRKLSHAPRHPWLVNRECPTFVTAGAHHPIKNHLFLMRVFQRINKSRRARLIVFGVGPMTEEYMAYIRENDLHDIVSVPGYCDNLPAEMKACDAYICSSLTESFSLTIVEALASGANVISTNCDYGPREVLENGRYGMLVPLGDEDAMLMAVMARIKSGRISVPDASWKRFTLDAAVARYEKALGL